MSTSNFEAKILTEHQDKFPPSFIKCIEEGTGWLCFHNGITYQTSLVVKTDKVIYNTSDADIVKIGLIDTSKPLSGLTYFGVNKVEEVNDTINGNTTFVVSAKYQTPVGIKLTIIPFQFYKPVTVPEVPPVEQFSNEWFGLFVKALDTLVKDKLGVTIDEAIEYVKSKADRTELENYYPKEDTYNKEEVYSKEQVYSKEETYSKEEVYPKDQVFTKDETYGKDQLYTKDELYTKTEVDDLVTA